MARTLEGKMELNAKLNDWVVKVLESYEPNAKVGVDTLRMIMELDKIIADAFDHDTVIQ